MTKPRQVRTSTVENSVPAKTAVRAAMNSLHVVFWLRLGAGANPCRLVTSAPRKHCGLCDTGTQPSEYSQLSCRGKLSYPFQ